MRRFLKKKTVSEMASCFVFFLNVNNVQLREQGVVCRDSKNECDIPEYCTGDSGECPKDVFMKNGNQCGEVKSALGETIGKFFIR